ncbi:MAG: hypothetical protein JRJ77_02620 [Deltaproteobacteria bacterium]|nr:hypothetical protein [Deltaproteobacteria bacterium]MBW2341646.1 hypothetical protein [Deltaproteobacteria bacterium]
MAEEKTQAKALSMSNTKKEMLDAYNALLKQLQEKRQAELKPEKKIEEKKEREIVKVAETLSSEGVVKDIGNLKLEIGKRLTQIADGLEEEVNKYKKIQEAIKIRDGELKELYEIERSAETLAALIEAQKQRRQEFESEMAARKEELNQEIQIIREGWEKDKKAYEAQIKERDNAEAKTREREKEEYSYTFRREQQLAKDRFEDEKAKTEKEILLKKEQMEKDLAEREKAIAESEEELNELREKVAAFPKETEQAVNTAVKETTQRITVEAKNKEELLRKEFDGQRNVLTTRIESLEKTVKEQSGQIANLSEQLEKSYQKVQDIAVKSVEGSSSLKSLTSLQQLVTEQTRKQSQEK